MAASRRKLQQIAAGGVQFCSDVALIIPPEGRADAYANRGNKPTKTYEYFRIYSPAHGSEGTAGRNADKVRKNTKVSAYIAERMQCRTQLLMLVNAGISAYM